MTKVHVSNVMKRTGMSYRNYKDKPLSSIVFHHCDTVMKETDLLFQSALCSYTFNIYPCLSIVDSVIVYSTWLFV